MLENGTLVRQIVHEVHHCLRMRGPGYGWTLGYQMVAAWRRDNAECATEKWFSVTADEVIAAGLAKGLLTN